MTESGVHWSENTVGADTQNMISCRFPWAFGTSSAPSTTPELPAAISLDDAIESYLPGSRSWGRPGGK
jgi:hypothetical protein